jgi:hypothetical protein
MDFDEGMNARIGVILPLQVKALVLRLHFLLSSLNYCLTAIFKAQLVASSKDTLQKVSRASGQVCSSNLGVDSMGHSKQSH